MREHHAHIAALGQSLALPNLADCASLTECLDRVRAAAADVRPGGWVRMLGARVESWPERRWPTLQELDRAAAHRSCILMSFDHHAAVANSNAMRAGGVRPGVPVPPKGVVCADEHGNATGLLLEHAAYKVWEAAPEPTRAEVREHVRAGLAALRDLGYTEVHDLHAQEWLGPVLAELERTGELPVHRVLLYANVAKLEGAHATRTRWESDRIRLAGGKLFADGTLNNRTALMLHPYREPLNNQPLGRMMATPAEADRALALTESLGLHLAVHAIGDGAVRMVLDAIERRRAAAPRGPRHRIEHCELIDERDVPRFASLNAICSVQPCHLLTDVDVLTRQLPDRLHRVLPLRDLIDAGCAPAGPDGSGLLWFGSDVPIVRANAEDSVQAATRRRRADPPGHTPSPPLPPIAPAQAITQTEALACFGKPTHAHNRPA